MGTGDGGTPTKTTKAVAVAAAAAATSTSQEQQPATPTYPSDWATALQTYYSSGTPPPGYYPPPHPPSGPQPHPFIWGGQPMMAPYGTPPPPHASMYAYGGMYAHPSLAHGSNPYGQYGMPSPSLEITTVKNTEPDAKSSEGKSAKRSKGSLGTLAMLTGKGSEGGSKVASGSANGHSQSGDSGSDNSSEGSEDEDGHDEGTQQEGKEGPDQLNLDGNGVNEQGYRTAPEGSEGTMNHQGEHIVGNQAALVTQGAVTGKPATALGPGTNLNVGIDYWGGVTPVPLASMKGKHNMVNMGAGLVPTAMAAQPIAMAREGMPPDLWLQDERELKRQRRKQSNRESARRSRLRKQAECEDLSRNVDALTVENTALRSELENVKEAWNKLSEENAALLAQLQKLQGENAGGGSQEHHVNQYQNHYLHDGTPDQMAMTGATNNHHPHHLEGGAIDQQGKKNSSLVEQHNG